MAGGAPRGLREGQEAVCLPDVLRGQQGLRLAFIQSARGEVALFPPSCGPHRSGAFRLRVNRGDECLQSHSGPLLELLSLLDLHPWMQIKADADFVMETEESDGSPFDEPAEGSSSDRDVITPPQVTGRSLGLGELHVTPLVTPMSLKENKGKRTIKRGKELVSSAEAHPAKAASVTASPPPKVLSDTSKIVLERRIAELRKNISTATKRDDHAKEERLFAELAQHQTALGFTPDDPPQPPKASREEDAPQSAFAEQCPSLETNPPTGPVTGARSLDPLRSRQWNRKCQNPALLRSRLALYKKRIRSSLPPRPRVLRNGERCRRNHHRVF